VAWNNAKWRFTPQESARKCFETRPADGATPTEVSR